MADFRPIDELIAEDDELLDECHHEQVGVDLLTGRIECETCPWVRYANDVELRRYIELANHGPEDEDDDEDEKDDEEFDDDEDRRTLRCGSTRA